MTKVGGYKKIIITTLLFVAFLLVPAINQIYAQSPNQSMSGAEAQNAASRQSRLETNQATANATLQAAQDKLEQAQNNPDETTEHIQRLQQQVTELTQQQKEAQAKLDANTGTFEVPKDATETYCSFSILSGFGHGGGLWKCLLWLISAFLNVISFSIISVIMTFSGWLMDIAIYVSIIGMDSILKSSGVIFVWTTTRDLANMSLIFVLLYTAFNIIIKGTSNGDVKKLVTGVITVALLINFSGFFVRAATDVSNVVAYEFYKAIIPKNAAAQSMFGSVSWGFIANSQAAKFFMARSQSNETTGDEGQWENQTKNLSLAKMFGDFFFDILFGGISFFVFIYLAILFMLRIITITAIFMFSPIMVLTYAIPGIKKTASGLQKNLTNQLIFAPVMMFFLYVLVMMMQKGIGFDAENSTGFWGGIWGNSLNSAIYYIIIMGILIKSVGWAKGIADNSGGMAGKLTGMVAGGAQALGGFAVGWSAKTPYGKNITSGARNWYNSDRFGAKTARAFGRSTAGQAVGDFAKKPLTATAEKFNLNFVDKTSAEKWGNIVETSQKAKQKQIEERAFGSDDKKYNDEKVLMNFLNMNEKDREHVYSKMSDKQRGLVDHVLATGDTAAREKIIDGMLSAEKLDKATINSINDPIQKTAAQAKADTLKAKVAADLDRVLGTEADIAKAFADEKVAKTAEAAATANPNNQTLRTAANRARTTANTSAQRSPIVRIANGVAKAKSSLSGKEKGEVTKARRTIENKATSSIGKNVAKELINNTATSVDDATWDPKYPAPGIARVNAIRSISGDDIVDLFESDPDKFIGPAVVPGITPVDNFVKFLTSKQMKALSDSSTINKPQFATIIEKLKYYKNRDPRSSGDQDLANTITYIEKNPDKF